MDKKQDVKDSSEPKAQHDTKQQTSGESDSGIVVSEEYQKQAHSLTHKANKHQIAHVRTRVNDREDELRKAEMKGSGKKSPATMSTDGMPD